MIYSKSEFNIARKFLTILKDDYEYQDPVEYYQDALCDSEFREGYLRYINRYNIAKKMYPTLNDEQTEVAISEENTNVNGPPGTGKTNALVHKAVFKIQYDKISPKTMMLSTFTKSAANDIINKMKEFGLKEIPLICTLHSLIYREIIKPHLKEFFKKHPTFVTETVKSNIIKKILDEFKIKHLKISECILYIDELKSSGIFSNEIKQGVYDENFVYRKYQEEMVKNCNMDYDDIMLYALLLDEKKLNVFEELRQKYNEIFIDEIQDVNLSQVKVIKLLMNDNVTIAGDLLQQLYTWRGATGQLIKDFKKDSNISKINLVKNYRQCKIGVENINRFGRFADKDFKDLKCTRKNEGVCGHVFYETWKEEFYFVIEKIKNLIAQGYEEKDIVILSRINRPLDYLQKKLIINGVPAYKIRGSDFYKLKEVNLMLSYLNILINPHSTHDLKILIKLINGIGDKRINLIFDLNSNKKVKKQKTILSYSNEQPVIEKTAFELFEDYKNNNKEGETIQKKLDMLYDSIKKKDLDLFIEFLIKYLCGYEKCDYEEYKRSEEIDHAHDNYHKGIRKVHERFENIIFIKNLLPQKLTIENVREMVEEMFLMKGEDESSKMVTLSTIHSFKGLEKKIVFLIECVQGVLPGFTENYEIKDDMEERSLFNVAISRNRDQLFITGSANPYSKPFLKNVQPSEYLNHLKWNV